MEALEILLRTLNGSENDYEVHITTQRAELKNYKADPGERFDLARGDKGVIQIELDVYEPRLSHAHRPRPLVELNLIYIPSE